MNTFPNESKGADAAGFYRALGVDLRSPSGSGEATVRCFANPERHARDDRNPSASVNLETGAWYCQRCGEGGGPYQAALACGRTPAEAMALLDKYGFSAPSAPAQSENVYDYVDEQGEILFQVVRKPGKKFVQRRPDGMGGWVWKRDGIEPVLYRLPQVLAAAAQGGSVYIAEGEKDVAALEQAGVVATCNSGGAGKWQDRYSESLRGVAEVVVVADRDELGEAHAVDIAVSLRKQGVPVRIVVAKEGKDAADHLAAGHSLEEFVPMDELAPVDAPESPLTVDEILAARPELTKEELLEENPLLKELLAGSKSVAARIVDLVHDVGAELLHDDEGNAYARIARDGHRETLAIRSKAFKRFVRYLYFQREQAVPSGQSLNDAIATLEAEALFEGPTLPVFLRVGSSNGAIYLDLGDPDWRVVEIAAAGWRTLSESPVHFRRTATMAAFPSPTPGELGLLRELVNVASDDDFRLLVGWLLGAFQPPQNPFPLLVLHGEQGSAKSTTARMVRDLVDPNSVPLRAGPREVRDLMIAASQSWVLSFDNLSGLPDWLSDALCRLATGGGFATRELYSDSEEIVFNAQRPVILNGIEELTTRSDLLDRSLLVSLPRIPEDERRNEKDLARAFEQARPAIFGALLDGVAAALANHETTQLERKPRMADFATWVTAAEPGLQLPAGSFLAAYDGNRSAGHELAIESTPIGSILLQLTRDGFIGTATELLALLTLHADERARTSRDWPKSAIKLAGQVKRLAPDLRALGCDIDFAREPGSGRRLILLNPTQTVTAVTPVTDPTPDNPASNDDRDNRDGRDDQSEPGTAPGGPQP